MANFKYMHSFNCRLVQQKAHSSQSAMVDS